MELPAFSLRKGSVGTLGVSSCAHLALRCVADRLEVMSVRVQHESRVIVGVIGRAETGRTLVPPSGRQGRSMEQAHGLSRWRPQRQVKSGRGDHLSLQRRIFEADIEGETLDELRIFVGRPIGVLSWNLEVRYQTEGGQRGIVKGLCLRKVVH